MSFARLLVVVGCLFVVIVFGTQPVLPQGEKPVPKTIELPVSPKQKGELVRVAFKVEFASPAPQHTTMNLHSMKDWKNLKSLWVQISPEALIAYRKLGILNPAAHYFGKTIQVEGTIVKVPAFMGAEKPKNQLPNMAIVVTDPAQIQFAKSRWESPAFQAWMKEVVGLPAKKQVEAVARKLVEFNPGFDGKTGLNDRGEAPKIENGRVTEIQLFSDRINDLSPVRALGGLKSLTFVSADDSFNGMLADLAPLQGMRLTKLSIHGNRKLIDLSALQGMPLSNLDLWLTGAADLSPLKGMPLTVLSLRSTPVVDLSPLKGAPLTSLDCTDLNGVTDLSPLQGMKLTKLWLNGTKAPDLASLRGMPLEFLEANRMQVVADLSPLKGMPLTHLEIAECPKIADLSPLRGMPLKTLRCDVRQARDTKALRSIKSLERINERPAAEFWK